jgi:hypothetical protein
MLLVVVHAPVGGAVAVADGRLGKVAVDVAEDVAVAVLVEVGDEVDVTACVAVAVGVADGPTAAAALIRP